MSVTVAHAEPSIAGVGDYIELMKPRVMSLVVFTALVGLVRAPVPMHPVMAFTSLSRRSIYRLIESGVLLPIKLSGVPGGAGRIGFKGSEVGAWLASRARAAA